MTTGLGMGGAEKQVCDLADSFYKKGISVIIISLYGEPITTPNNPHIKIYSLKSKKSLLSIFKVYLKCSRIIKKFNPDIVHSHMFHANIFARMLRMISRFPILICTAHNTIEGGWGRMAMYRMTDMLATLSTNVSSEAVSSFENKGAVKRGHMIVMNNGIDTGYYHYSTKYRDLKRKELNLDSDDVLLLAVGRLTEAKNYPNMLSAFNLIKTQKNVHLAIIGAGEKESELKAIAKIMRNSDKIHWLGLRHDVREWMSAMDIYVMSSSWEGMPLVLCEAMSCSGFVIATDCGGVTEIVADAGLVVPKESPDKLSIAITQVIDSEQYKNEDLKSKARQRIINNFSIDTVTNNWLDIFEKYTK